LNNVFAIQELVEVGTQPFGVCRGAFVLPAGGQTIFLREFRLNDRLSGPLSRVTVGSGDQQKH
jgi:hypothetical protein